MYPAALVLFVHGLLLSPDMMHFTYGQTLNRQITEPLSYSQLIIAKYSQKEYFSEADFIAFYDSLQFKGFPESNQQEMNAPPLDKYSQWCSSVLTNGSCFGKCEVREDVFNTYSVKSRLNSSSLIQALPAVIIAHEIEYCQTHRVHHAKLDIRHRQKPQRKLVWGYGIGFVVLICLVSNLGGVLAPLTKSSFFQKLLMFLVSIAVGTLVATGLIVLIPESLDLMSIEMVADEYIWKTATVLGGILFFFFSERLLKIGFTSKKLKKDRKLKEKTTEENELVIITPAFQADDATHSHFTYDDTPITDKEGESKVRTVAWMMLLGDGLHKFVDGLSVGAAYSQSIRTGLTLSIAILCEELPHELGDIAILLHSGMTMKMALLFNTLSAAVGLLGLIVGIFLGEVKSASQWIFAVAAGIFLYVPLVDMRSSTLDTAPSNQSSFPLPDITHDEELPEMSQAADKAIGEGSSALWITFIQIFGLCLGFLIILIVAIYSGNITF